MAIRNFSKTFDDPTDTAPGVLALSSATRIFEIQIDPADPHFVQNTALDGTSFSLIFDWNAREGAWYLTLSDADGVVIAAGRKLVADWFPLRNVIDVRRPPGLLMVQDTTGAGRDPGRYELGSRVKLIYFEAGT